MKLFEVVPGNFFSVLSSSNKEIYCDALMILHDMFNFELNIRVDDFLSSLITVLEDRAFELEEDDESDGNLTLSGKARLVLNRLIKTGWVDKEYIDNSFVEIITPRSYAIPVLKLLSEMGDSTLQEYNSLVFATFSGLKQALNEDEAHLYEALLSANKNTEQLQYSLRALYHGIRGFLRNIVEQNDVNLLLQDHFNEYKKLSDRVYHPIKTMDSVYRYMVPVQNLLMDILSNENTLQFLYKRAMTVKKYEEMSLAEDDVIKSIDFIIDFYQTVGNLVSEIDRKHSTYTKSSIEKVQYLMTADQSIKGKLADILKAYASATEEKREVICSKMEENIRANRQEYFDAHSLYHKKARNQRTNVEPLAVELNKNLSEFSNKHLLAQINSMYTPNKIRSFVKTLLSDRDELTSSDIPITCDSDFILLILAVIRQNDKGMPYSIETNSADKVERNGYFIPDMVIRRKES